MAPLKQRAAQELAPVAGVLLVRPPLPLKRERRVPRLSGGAPIRVRAPSAVGLREMKRARFGDDLVTTYGQFIDHVDTDSHWLHETPHATSLARRFAEFYRWYDGVHPLLRDRGEVGTVAVPVRSRDSVRKEDLDERGDPSIPKAVPEHRHHNWGFTTDPVRIP